MALKTARTNFGDASGWPGEPDEAESEWMHALANEGAYPVPPIPDEVPDNVQASNEKGVHGRRRCILLVDFDRENRMRPVKSHGITRQGTDSPT